MVFRYAPGRGQEHAKKLLGDYAGLLQCDGYAAYKSVSSSRAGGPTLAFCWAHVRREFFDLSKGGTAPIATEALRRIAELYAIEAEVRGKPPDVRRAARQARSKPLVEDLFSWLEAQLARLPGRSPTAEKIRYALNHRGGLERFLDDGRLDIDSNVVERTIRPVVLSRKNALFASGDDGGERWTCVASLVETCMCGWPPRCKGNDGGVAESRQRACVRPTKCGHMTAGPDEIRGSGPYQADALVAHRSLLGVPISSSDRRVITSISADAPRSPTAHGGCPSQVVL